jgi:tRNA(adenine34) deaminase
MLSVFDETYFMRAALQEARQAAADNEIPVGAVVVLDNRIIARAHNQTERLNDVTAHAEMLALTAAANYLGSKYLMDCSLYVTLEPCVMCAGALAWAQIGRVIYGASDEKRGFVRTSSAILHPKTTVAYGILEAECADLLREFFQRKRV